MSIEDTMAAIVAWQRATFGSADPAGVALKVQAEAREFAEALAAAVEEVGPLGEWRSRREHLAEEAADVLFLLLDGLRAADIQPAALARALARKLAKNRHRMWQQGTDGQWSHVKDGICPRHGVVGVVAGGPPEHGPDPRCTECGEPVQAEASRAASAHACPDCSSLISTEWDGEGDCPGHKPSCPEGGNPPSAWLNRGRGNIPKARR